MYSANKIRVMGVNNYTSTTAGSFDVVVTDKNGSSTITSGEDLLFKQKLADGTFQTLGVIKNADFKKATKATAVTAVPAYATVQAIAGAIGDLHRIEIAINNFGSDSFEDQYIKQGNHEATAATALSNALGLVSSLYKNYSRDAVVQNTSFIHPNDGFDAVSSNLDETAEPATAGLMTYSIADSTWYVANAEATKEWKDIADATVVSAVTSGLTAGELYIVKATSTTGTLYYATDATTAVSVSAVTYHKTNPFFTFVTTSAGLVYIAEKDQPFVAGKFQSKPIIFGVTGKVYDVSDAYSETNLTVVEYGRVKNPVDAKEMANLEWFCNGYKGDIYRGMGYPNNLETSGLVNTSTAYKAIYTIHTGNKGLGMNAGSEVDNILHILVASTSANGDGTAGEAIEEAIETAFGVTL